MLSITTIFVSALNLPIFAVIVAIPFDFGVTTPFATVATFSLLVVQTTSHLKT